jgi:short-subunit dehydrogenase
MTKAIVIGASSGIGKAVSEILVKKGYLVGITGRRKTNLLEIQQTSPENIVIKCFDCKEDNAIEKLDEIVAELGGLDLVIFSSGIGEFNEALDFEIEKETINLNVLAFTKICTWSYRFFQKQGFGHLVAISSIAGLRGNKTAPSYNASKAFQISYLEGLRQKSNKTNITITDIRPGFVDTNMAKGDGLFWVASKEKAANQIYDLIQKKREIGYISKRWVIIALILKTIPNFIYKKM